MNEQYEKSKMNCDACKSNKTVRIQWLDAYPEGSHWYDDHICLDCGRIINQPGLYVCKKTLEKYREEYRYLCCEEKNETW